MRLLVDTHAFLWFIDDDPRLSQQARVLMTGRNELFLSIASLWEMAIKISLGRLTIPLPYSEFIRQQLSINHIEILPIEIDHLSLVADLPFHHRDPFDRMLIAQGLKEQLPILSTDAAFDAYQVARYW
jgi:PIN domain nuclease of toxin-antitoxin system